MVWDCPSDPPSSSNMGASILQVQVPGYARWPATPARSCTRSARALRIRRTARQPPRGSGPPQLSPPARAQPQFTPRLLRTINARHDRPLRARGDRRACCDGGGMLGDASIENCPSRVPPHEEVKSSILLGGSTTPRPQGRGVLRTTRRRRRVYLPVVERVTSGRGQEPASNPDSSRMRVNVVAAAIGGVNSSRWQIAGRGS